MRCTPAADRQRHPLLQNNSDASLFISSVTSCLTRAPVSTCFGCWPSDRGNYAVSWRLFSFQSNRLNRRMLLSHFFNLSFVFYSSLFYLNFDI